jgi:hypothetical protein
MDALDESSTDASADGDGPSPRTVVLSVVASTLLVGFGGERAGERAHVRHLSYGRVPIFGDAVDVWASHGPMRLPCFVTAVPNYDGPYHTIAADVTGSGHGANTRDRSVVGAYSGSPWGSCWAAS